jgi:hypothetical protein
LEASGILEVMRLTPIQHYGRSRLRCWSPWPVSPIRIDLNIFPLRFEAIWGLSPSEGRRAPIRLAEGLGFGVARGIPLKNKELLGHS